MHNTQRHPPLFSHYTQLPHYKQSFWRCCLLLIGVLFLGACSSTKMAYDYADWVAMWKIDRMVDLTAAQRNQVKSDVQALHHWHRKTQLPRYADHLEQARKRLQPGSVTAEQLHAETDEIQLLLDDSLERVIPIATEAIAGLSDKQVHGLLENLTEERQEYVEEFIEPGVEKRQQKNADDFKTHAKRFIGRLTSEQEKWVEEWSQQLIPYAELSAKQQELWQEHLAKYLTLRQNKELLQQGLRELMLYRTDNWNPELQEAMDQNQEMTYELIARLLNNLTDKQRSQLDKTLQNFIQDFRSLSRAG